MNCKQGDLAIVIRGPDTGACLTCLEYVGDTIPLNGRTRKTKHGRIWRVDKEITWYNGGEPVGKAPFMYDAYLLPISHGNEQKNALTKQGNFSETGRG